MESPNVRKLANASVPNATPSDVLPSAAFSAAQRFKRKHSGLWVGDTPVVASGGVSFAPNGVNRALHEDLEAVVVAARDIKSVRHEFGWFTGVVVVTHVRGEFRFRCYGAKKLAAMLAVIFGEAGCHAEA